MRVILSLVFSILIVITSCVSWAEGDPYANLVNRTVSALMKQNNIPGAAVVLYVNGEPHVYNYGYANVESQNKVTRTTIFEIGSITKVMTSLLLTQEVDYARMQLTDSVQKYIPELPDTFRNVTLQSLATHTSGLPFALPNTVRSGDGLENYLDHWRPQYAPDKQWQYSNAGVGLLSIALENATQMEINELYVRHILNPLRMMPIGVAVPEKFKPYVAQGYNASNKPVPPLDMGIFPGAGGVKMSANDMQKFLSAALGMPNTPVRVLYPMLMTELGYVRLGDGEQGLGWNITSLNASINTDLGMKSVKEVIPRPFYNSKALFDKTGTTNGFKAYMAIIPYKKSGIAIFVNKAIATNSIVSAGRTILSSVAR